MPQRWGEPDRRTPTAAAVVFGLLLLATVAAFAYAQRLKRDPLVLDRVTFVGAPRHKDTGLAHSFTPNDDCRHDLMRIRFRVTQSHDATVQIVKPGGRVVLTLARDEFLKRYHFFTYYWDGRQRDDGTASPGRYKLRVRLGSERTLVTPGVIRLHRAPKRAKSQCGTGGGAGGLGAGSEP
ncbi:MAG TPA: hypothetical protein VNB59_03195 [Solirubrobacterales bacterium]|jgi:hypothetical protein|nr:hypothetical protein [Solirubrobacterales bacterium]